MRNYAFRFLVSVLTFLVGVLLIYPFQWFGSSNSALTPTEDVSPGITEYSAPRFIPTADVRGGRGSGVTYQTNDNEQILEYVVERRSVKAARKEVQAMIAKAKQIVEHDPLYRNTLNEVSERVVLVNVADGPGKERAMILSYGGGTVYRFITASTVDLALEFEQYLIEEKKK